METLPAVEIMGKPAETVEFTDGLGRRVSYSQNEHGEVLGLEWSADSQPDWETWFDEERRDLFAEGRRLWEQQGLPPFPMGPRPAPPIRWPVPQLREVTS